MPLLVIAVICNSSAVQSVSARILAMPSPVKATDIQAIPLRISVLPRLALPFLILAGLRNAITLLFCTRLRSSRTMLFHIISVPSVPYHSFAVPWRNIAILFHCRTNPY